MASIFISYSRKDIDLAHQLTEAFEGQDLDFWIDWEDIPPTVEWWQEIEKGIEEADIFLFLLSPDSVASKYCKKEIEHAAQNGKRLIPIVVRDITEEGVPPELDPINWIFFNQGHDFNTAFNKLITAIKTDYEWVQIHRRLQVRALEWERAKRDNSFLLRGNDLQEAEAQLVANSGKNPIPTDLQTNYVINSRQASDRQRRTVTGIAIAVVIALAALAIFGFRQANLATDNAREAQTQAAKAQAASTLAVANEGTALANEKLAEERAKIARAGELAAQALATRDSDFPVSLLLGVEAYKTFETSQTRKILFGNLQAYPNIRRYLYVGGVLITIAVSPDGMTLATGSCNVSGNCPQAEIILWNLADLRPIGQPLPLQEGIFSLAFSPDSKVLATGSWQIITLWDVITRGIIGQPLQSQGIKLSFSPDGKKIASSGINPRNLQQDFLIWDLGTQQLIYEYLAENQTYEGYLVRFNPNGRTFASSRSDENRIILWDSSTYQPIGQLFVGNNSKVSSFTFSPNGNILASGYEDQTVILWDLTNYSPIRQPLTGHTGPVYDIAFSPDGNFLATRDSEHTIILWDVASGAPIGQPFKGPGRVFDLVFSLDGNTLISGSGDNNVVFWDLLPRQPLSRTLVKDLPYTNDLAFSPDGKIIASAHDDYTVRLWDAASGNPIGLPLAAHVDYVTCVAFSPDGKNLAAGSEDQTIILWDVTSNLPIGSPLTKHTGGINDVTFSPDGKLLASSSQDNTIIVWDVATGLPIGQVLTATTDFEHGTNHLTFSPDGKLLAAVEDDLITILDITSQPFSMTKFPEVYEYIDNITFSSDGKMLTSIDQYGNIIIWNIATQVPTNTSLPEADMWGGNEGYAAFSLDGKIAISRDMVLWDVETVQSLGEALAGEEEWFTNMVFSPDGNQIASINGNRDAVILWNLNPQSWLDLTCQRVGRNLTRAEWAQYFPNEDYRLTCPQWPAGE